MKSTTFTSSEIIKQDKEVNNDDQDEIKHRYILELGEDLKPIKCESKQILIVEKNTELIVLVSKLSLLTYFNKKKQSLLELENFEFEEDLTFSANKNDEFYLKVSNSNHQEEIIKAQSHSLNINYCYQFLIKEYGTVVFSFESKSLLDAIKSSIKKSPSNKSALLTALESKTLGNEFFNSHSIYVHIEPKFELNNKKYSLKNIRMQTILSKSLGTLEEWDKYFSEASFLEYNFIHFTPIQSLGFSDSLYCLNNHNTVNDVFFKNHKEKSKLSESEKLALVKEKISKGRKEYNLCSIVDVVLNHIAGSCNWITEHPNAGFNLENSPHLTVAYELEKLLMDYNNRYENMQTHCKSAPYIYTKSDIQDIIEDLRTEIINNDFFEYFKLDISKQTDKILLCHRNKTQILSKYIKSKTSIGSINPDKADFNNINLRKYSHNDEKSLISSLRNTVINQGHNRFSTEIDAKEFYLLIYNNRHIKDLSSSRINSKNEKEDEENFIIAIRYYLLQLNNLLMKEYNEMVEDALKNIFHHIQYQFVDLNDHLVDSSRHHGIYTNYFTVKNKDKKSLIFANNGWIYGCTDPTINFASKEYMNYFTRSIIAWGDCIKLNYFGNSNNNHSSHGNHYHSNNIANSNSNIDSLLDSNNNSNLVKSCSPDLLEYITNYITSMADIFDGLRLDNAHSTPIHIAEYLIKEARKVKPNLIIVAELFAGSEEREIELVNRAGINLLIRECIYCHCLNDLSRELHYYGGGLEHVFGKLRNCSYINDVEYQKLSGEKPKSIIYDMSHDNKTINDIFNNSLLSLSFISVLGFSLSAIGTTKGVDELYPKNPSVVRENRKYKLLDVKNINNYNIKDSSDCSKHSPTDINNNTGEENYNWHELSFSSSKKQYYTFNFPKDNVKSKVILFLSTNWEVAIPLSLEGDFYTTTIQIETINNNRLFYKFLVDNTIWSINPLEPTDWDNNGSINNVIDFNHRFDSLQVLRKFINNKFREHLSDAFQLYLNQDTEKNTLSLYLYNSKTKTGFFMCHRSAFCNDPKPIDFTTTVPGEITEFLSYSYLRKAEVDNMSSSFKSNNNSNTITPYDSKLYITNENMNVDFRFSTSPKYIKDKVIVEKKEVLHFKNLPYNSTIIATFSLTEEQISKQNKMTELLNTDILEFDRLLEKTSIVDINYLLYSCEAEEHARTNYSRGTYYVPNFVKFPYCGFENLFHYFSSLRDTSPMDHPLFENIRQGDWLLNYSIERLKDYKVYGKLYEFLCLYRDNYCIQPAFIKPRLFNDLLAKLESVVDRRIKTILCFKNSLIINPISSDSRDSKKRLSEESNIIAILDKFTFDLKKASIQFIANLLPPSNLEVFENNTEDIKRYYSSVSISAGLPHFSTGYMRSWGRDTFISFTGILLVNKQYDLAKITILDYASCLRHGLIPNLYDFKQNPRYNARDATWFFMKAIIDYIKYTKDESILEESIEMIFEKETDADSNSNKNVNQYSHSNSKNNSNNNSNTNSHRKNSLKLKTMKLKHIIIEIFSKHAEGISFREWNAGSKIDENMTDEGFNINISMNKNNGFIYGGNKHNCGTWMDKMGSAHFVNKGLPASSRHGANIELISLLYYSLVFFNNFFNERKEYKDLTLLKLGSKKQLVIKLSDWAELIKINFEKEFLYERNLSISTSSGKSVNSFNGKSTSNINNNSGSYGNLSNLTNLNNNVANYNNNNSINNVKLNDNYFKKETVDLGYSKKITYLKDVISDDQDQTFLLRPNYIIALALTPELISKEKGELALKTFEKYLLIENCMGVRTLSNIEKNYNGDYNNSDSTHGFNYHNGPEWLWPMGYYLMAKIIFINNDDSIIYKQSEIQNVFAKILKPYIKHINESDWRGLPELTNSNGSYCSGSCNTQAWSIATILEALNKSGLLD